MTNDKNKKGGVTAESDVHYFSVTDPIWFRDFNEPTDPNPAPGTVMEETGENDFRVEIYTSAGTEGRNHVGTVAANSYRYIEPRDPLGGEV